MLRRSNLIGNKMILQEWARLQEPLNRQVQQAGHKHQVSVKHLEHFKL